MMRDKLIANGVRNLQEFGYPSCTKDNILTDMIFRRFFVSMLKDNKGINGAIDGVIDALLAECTANESKPKPKPKRKGSKS